MTLPIPFDGTKIFVDNLEPSVEWQDLKDFCAQVGAVAFVKVDKMPMPAHGAGGLSFGAAFQRGVIATSGANHPTAKIEVRESRFGTLRFRVFLWDYGVDVIM
ncbi:unnamed protein product [Symbiodinium sp. KB8]|nr:unnamed protein product [Symbiodinium sp. KB8]